MDHEARLHLLLTTSQSGDRAAYRELLLELNRHFSQFCGRFLRHSDLAKDCTQECLIAIHRSLHTFHPSYRALPWVNALARNKVIDFLRSRRTLGVPIDNLEQDYDSSLEKRVEAQQLLQHLFKELPIDLRAAIVLTKIFDLSHREAAHRLGIPLATLNVRIFRALSKLKCMIERDTIVPGVLLITIIYWRNS